MKSILKVSEKYLDFGKRSGSCWLFAPQTNQNNDTRTKASKEQRPSSYHGHDKTLLAATSALFFVLSLIPLAAVNATDHHHDANLPMELYSVALPLSLVAVAVAALPSSSSIHITNNAMAAPLPFSANSTASC